MPKLNDNNLYSYTQRASKYSQQDLEIAIKKVKNKELTNYAASKITLKNNISLTKEDELNAELEKAVSEKRIRSSAQENEDLCTNVGIEMALFENGGDRGRYLSQAYDHLLTIPTSVEPERVFFSAGLLCNKIRSRLSDKSLDALLFLRSYYRERAESS